MNVSQPFRSSHNIGGVECDFPSKEELLRYITDAVFDLSPLPNWGEGGGEGNTNGIKRKNPIQSGLTHIVTLNAEMVVEAQHNEQFRNAIMKAEIVIPDGSSILWAREYLEQVHQALRHPGHRAGIQTSRRRGFRVKPGMTMFFSLIKFFFSKHQPITGVDTIFDICEIIEKKNGTVYLLGGKQNEAEKTAEVLGRQYPGLNVSITSPNPSFVRRGNAPSAIFVALGSPKQTLWIEHNRKALTQAGISIAMGVGGAFAMISGTLPRAPKWMRQHHMEWFWRLLLEPKRIQRIWNAVVVFPKLIYTSNR